MHCKLQVRAHKERGDSYVLLLQVKVCTTEISDFERWVDHHLSSTKAQKSYFGFINRGVARI